MAEVKYTLISSNRRFSNASHKAIVFIGILILAALSIITYTSTVHYETADFFEPFEYDETKKIETTKKCFQSAPNSERLLLLPDILEHKRKPKPGKSIFFLVTTCSTDGSVTLNARQACAIESAARINQNREIFVLFAAPVGFAENGTKSPILNVLLSYPNIQFRNLDIVKYSIGTPGELWIQTDRIYLSNFIVAHMADYLRFITLYKFGGIYFDLDIIVLKNLDKMPPNFSGAENEYWTAIGAMGFEPDNVGHKIIEAISKENIEAYLPDEWAESGVGAMTRVIQRICHTNSTFETKPESCLGFKVFPPSTFYAIHWRNWTHFFSTDPEIVNETLLLTKDSITTHVWNKFAEKQVIDKSKPETAFGKLAQINCPNVFEASGSYF